MIAQLALAVTVAAPPDHWFGADKLKHFFVSALTQSATYSVLQASRVKHDRALAAAWTVTAAVSVAKEVHDLRTTGLFSVRDLVWDAAGAGLATVLIAHAVRTPGAESTALPTARAGRSSFSDLSDVATGPILPGVVPNASESRR